MPALPFPPLLFAIAIAGCGVDESPWVEGEIGRLEEGLTVAQAGGCSTAIVAGLSKQLIDEQNCIRPNALVSFAGKAGIDVGAGVFPFLEPPAAAALEKAALAQGGKIQISSAFRTLAQQFLLYKWQGSCGIQIAASPGKSNHETGLALDVSNHGAWQATLQKHSWQWYGANDVVHFDYVGGGTIDLRGESVLAFQRLWNLNNPNDKIGEDGDYGPQTAARLGKTDVNGFAKGKTCGGNPPPPPPMTPALAADRIGQGGPAQLTEGATATFWAEYRNTGTAKWHPATTRLGTTGPRDRASALASADWIQPSRPTGVDQETAPGAIGRFTFLVTAPAAPKGPVVYAEHFALVEEGVAWFGPKDDAYLVELEVRPAEHPPSEIAVPPPRALGSPDAGDPPPGDAGEPPTEAASGCNVGRRPATPSALLALIALLLLGLRAARYPKRAAARSALHSAGST